MKILYGLTSLAFAALSAGAAITTAGAAEKPAPAAEAPANGAAHLFFESTIRPLLIKQCVTCHGDRLQQGGLRLDTAEGFRQGGESGPLVAGRSPGKSLLIQAVDYEHDLKMPPQGKLSAAEIRDLTRWVEMGAPWPAAQPKPGAAIRPPGGVTPEDRAFWSFQPVRKPSVPSVSDRKWVRNPIDAFILQKLESKGLKPAPEADRRTLIRRVTFDLTGLPPTPEEIEEFLQDTGPDAYSRVIDRLLASPAYGERWGRHWLDVARYADSNGLDENTAMANAWRYRDWVIEAINDDKPYDEFVREQVAGDLLPPSADAQTNYDRLTATAFLALGPKVLAEPDKQKMLLDIADEQIDVVTRGFLGLTVSCARCHDHKFDPIPTLDYYALAGIFRSTKTLAKESTVAQVMERPLAPPDAVERWREFQKKRTDLDQKIQKAADLKEKKALQQELKELDTQRPAEIPMTVAVEDAAKPSDLRIHLRGDYLTLGEPAPRGFVQVVSNSPAPPIAPQGSGRRELADWLASDRNPLTSRVMVNRIWRHHFGVGIVRTVDNFGKLGDAPSHPELLDWLAAAFVEKGWSQKELHRIILSSSTYRMSSDWNERGAAADPENRLLWRFNRQRLEVEAIRDSMLFVSGALSSERGGSLLKTPNFGYVTNDQSNNQAQYDSPRRSIYIPVIRNAVYDLFQVFDFVEPSFLNGDRSVTTVAPQALFLLNGDLVREQSRNFASRLRKESSGDGARVRRAHELAYGRPATADEVASALQFIRRYEVALASREPDAAKRYETAWAAYTQALLASSEFITIN